MLNLQLWMFTWSESVFLFSVRFCFCTIIIKVSKYETRQSAFHLIFKSKNTRDVILIQPLYDSLWLAGVAFK